MKPMTLEEFKKIGHLCYCLTEEELDSIERACQISDNCQELLRNWQEMDRQTRYINADFHNCTIELKNAIGVEND